MASIPSMGAGLAHSMPLKVKYQRLQHLLQKATLKSPSNSTFKTVSELFLTKIQSCNREREFHMGFATVGKRTKTLDVH